MGFASAERVKKGEIYVKELQAAFQKIDIPSKRLLQHGYTIMDSNQGQIFLHINHLGLASKYGNIYISVLLPTSNPQNGQHNRFSQSLRYNVRTP